jgi:hypothetical protein
MGLTLMPMPPDAPHRHDARLSALDTVGPPDCANDPPRPVTEADGDADAAALRWDVTAYGLHWAFVECVAALPASRHGSTPPGTGLDPTANARGGSVGCYPARPRRHPGCGGPNGAGCREAAASAELAECP